MDAEAVGEKVIRPKLAEIFGATIADLLLTKATFAAMQGGTAQETYRLMVESVCSHPKVVAMWGAAQTEKMKEEWLRSGALEVA